MKFDIVLDCNSENFIKILTDYENLPNFLPRQLNSIKIIEESDNQKIIEAIIQFKTLIKKPITQTIQINKNNYELTFKILDGHAKNTKASIITKPQNDSLFVEIDIDLKLSLAAKILTPIIKREYKLMLQGVLMKMAVEAKSIE